MEGMRQLKDRSWKISIDTQELKGSQVAELSDYSGQFVKIMLTDENDCSDLNALGLRSGSDCEWQRDGLTPVETYIDFLTNLEGTAGGERVLVAGITGPDDGIRYDVGDNPNPSCSNPERKARGDCGKAITAHANSSAACNSWCKKVWMS